MLARSSVANNAAVRRLRRRHHENQDAGLALDAPATALLSSTQIAGRLAQLARAPARHAGGHRFKSCSAIGKGRCLGEVAAFAVLPAWRIASQR